MATGGAPFSAEGRASSHLLERLPPKLLDLGDGEAAARKAHGGGNMTIDQAEIEATRILDILLGWLVSPQFYAQIGAVILAVAVGCTDCVALTALVAVRVGDGLETVWVGVGV